MPNKEKKKMITYSEYFDDYVKDLNKYIHKIKASVHQIQSLKLKLKKKDLEGIQKTKEDIFEAEKCIKQIIVETNSLPKGSHQIFDDIPKHQADLKKYKQLLSKMSSDYYSDEVVNNREYDATRRYMEGTNFLKESEKRAQDVEDMGYTIMSELTAQRSAILRTKLYTDETRQEQNRVKRMLLSIYHNKVLFKCLLILIIILLAIANIGVIIYKIK